MCIRDRYDPVKRRLGVVFNRTPFLRKIFYGLLDLLLLRAWHIQRELTKWAADKRDRQLAIYDAGAGFGQYTYWLSSKSRKWNITAIDVKDEQVADCNAFFSKICLLYTSDAADERSSVDLGGRRIIKKKTKQVIDGGREYSTTVTAVRSQA